MHKQKLGNLTKIGFNWSQLESNDVIWRHLTSNDAIENYAKVIFRHLSSKIVIKFLKFLKSSKTSDMVKNRHSRQKTTWNVILDGSGHLTSIDVKWRLYSNTLIYFYSKYMHLKVYAYYFLDQRGLK